MSLLTAIICVADGIDRSVSNNRLTQKIFVELSRRINLLVRTVEAKYQSDALPQYAQDCMYALQTLLIEIQCYIDKQATQNPLYRFMKHQYVLDRIQNYEQSLHGLCQTFQVAVQDWNAVDLHGEYLRDQDDLKHFISHAFTDQNRTLDQIIGHLGIASTQYVDTMEVLRTEQRRASALNQEVLRKLSLLQDSLSMKSGRRVIKRAGAFSVTWDDLFLTQADPIGSGSFGKVFVGMWQNQKVAVKQAIDTVNSEAVISMLEKEASIWFPLKHPNIIPLWGVSLNTDKPFLIMPFLKNGTVMDYLARFPETPFRARVKFLCDVAFGMAYLHEQNVNHGDLKPDNILVGISF